MAYQPVLLGTSANDNTGDSPRVAGDKINDNFVELYAVDAALGTMSTQGAGAVAITGGSITGITDLAVADGGTGASTQGGARTNLGLVIGTDVQAYNANLAAIAGLTSAADRGILFTGSGAASVYTLTGAGRDLLDDSSASAQRTTLGLVIGTDVQAYDAELAAIAGLTSAADRLPYFTGSGTASLATFTSAGRDLLDDANPSEQRTTLGLGSFATVTPTGTPNGAKFLRDDNAWTAIPGGGDLLAANNLSDVASASTAINTIMPSQGAHSGKFLTTNGSAVSWGTPSGSGTVTSVGLSAPSFLSVSGSPVTTSGTLALSLATQTANTVLAGPTSGGVATPAFRALVAADVPDISATYLVKANNLSDVTASTARTNLGLGSAAVMTGPSGAIVGTTDAQNLTQKTFTDSTTFSAAAPSIYLGAAGSAIGGLRIFGDSTGYVQITVPSGGLGNRVLTLPLATDTLVGRDTTDTFTNKTMSGASNTFSNIPSSAVTGSLTATGMTIATARIVGRTTASTGAPEELTVGTGLTLSGGSLTNALVNGTVGITIDGGGSAITTGVKGFLEMPYAGTITGWTLMADQSGSIVVDIWKDTYANYPPTVADTITAAAKPTITTATKGQSTTLTGWTTSVAKGDIIGFNVDSITTHTRVTLSLQITRTS